MTLFATGTEQRWRRWGATIGALLVGLVVLAPVRADAIDVVVQYSDGAGEGFNDATLGAARKAAFEYAMGIWAARLEGNEIIVDAAMDSLGGSGSSAILGQASAAFVARDFTGAPLSGTWYPIGLANALAGEDLAPGSADVIATFNSDVDNSTVLGSVDWYYGTDANAGSDIDFVAVVLHEFTHGIGFFDMVSNTTGAWLNGFPDVYGLNLTRQGVGDFSSMSDSQRLAALTSDQVYWNGPNLVADNGGTARIYAPSPYEDGSSVSHFHTALTPDQLMEPFYTGPDHDPGLALSAMQDIGWTAIGGSATTTTGGSTSSTTSTSTTTTTLPSIDPFFCYKAKPSKKAAKFPGASGVALVDQFEVTTNDVLKPKAICNPTSLDGASILDPETHLTSYTTKGTPKHAPRKTLGVTTQLGTIFVDTVKLERLLVPAAKSLDAAPSAPDPNTHTVDHYKCYKIRLLKGSPTPHAGVQVVLADQFEQKSYTIKKPKRLCTPVDKNSEGIENPAGHLLCYSVKRSKHEPKHSKVKRLYVTDQFGSIQLDTKKEEVLCLGALKSLF